MDLSKSSYSTSPSCVYDSVESWSVCLSFGVESNHEMHTRKRRVGRAGEHFSERNAHLLRIERTTHEILAHPLQDTHTLTFYPPHDDDDVRINCSSKGTPQGREGSQATPLSDWIRLGWYSVS